MARLFELKNIIGVKDATGDLNRVTQQKNKMGNEFLMLSGNDENTYEFNKLGGSGCISVSANIAPKFVLIFMHYVILINLMRQKPFLKSCYPFMTLCLSKGNPVPAKYSLSLMNMMSEEVRLPFVTAEDSKEKIKAVLKSLSLI